MTSLDAVRLVAMRELHQAVRKKSLWAAAVVLLLGSTAAMVLPTILASDEARVADVVVIGDDVGFERALSSMGSALDIEIDISKADSAAAAAQLVEQGDVDIAVAGGASPSIIVRAGENTDLVGFARQALFTSALVDRLQDAGLDAGQAQAAIDVPAAEVRELDAASQSRRGTSAIISIVLYILLLTGMVQVANGTAVEKSNRISEMLLPVVRPGSLLFGKVIGVGITSTAILLCGLLPAVVKFSIGGDLPDGIGGALAASAAWFALGLGLYLTLAGMLGALVERQEEAGQVVSPLTFLLIGTFIVVQGSADSTVGAVLAYIPLTSPIAAPARIAIGVSSTVEIVASLAILAVTIVLVGRFASTLYARAIVRTGKRLKLRDVMRSAR